MGGNELEQTNYYQLLHKFSLFNTYFAFLDTEDYLADGLFIKHQVRVYFGDEFVNPDIPYRIIFCHVRKWDKERFCAAMRELPNKMLLCGNVALPLASVLISSTEWPSAARTVKMVLSAVKTHKVFVS